jgi:hypothetical protein
VVINEIMYHPAQDREDLQFIELHNPSSNRVDLSGWSLTQGVRFTFPWDTQLAPGGFAVVARDIAALRACYGPQVNIVGAFPGRLGHGGGTVRLVDAQQRLVDTVEFGDRSPWPLGADGYGGSLERICPAAASADAHNWAATIVRSHAEAGGTPGTTNTCFSPVPLPRVAPAQCGTIAPEQPIGLSTTVDDTVGVESVTVSWRASGDAPGFTAWTDLPMSREAGDKRSGVYTASLPPQSEGRLVQFKVRARSRSGAERVVPAPGEPRPVFTCHTFVNTNKAAIPFLRILTFEALPKPVGSARARAVMQASGANLVGPQPSGTSAVVYLPPGSTQVFLFDHVRVRPRKGGLKVHFHPDQMLAEMTGINVIFEASPRWLLSEYLAYDLYRRTGVPAPAAEHVRLWVDRRALGYFLMVEQPNRQFLRRNGRSPASNLYKVIWYGHGLTGQHERKTHPRAGYDDLVQVIGGLESTSGAAQWDFIQQQFNIDEMINYYAVNMCIQNWDGFFNNYFAAHDLRPGGKWEMYPWDEDKTWGDHDGASPRYDWYEMPLTMGMKGDRPPGGSFLSGRFWGNQGWWRPPGYFSGPLLANPEFRRRFLSRLRVLCENTFTPEVMGPVIDALAKRLEPEVAERARLTRTEQAGELGRFHADIQSFHRQVANRRQFILQQLAREPAGKR